MEQKQLENQILKELINNGPLNASQLAYIMGCPIIDVSKAPCQKFFNALKSLEKRDLKWYPASEEKIPWADDKNPYMGKVYYLERPDLKKLEMLWQGIRDRISKYF